LARLFPQGQLAGRLTRITPAASIKFDRRLTLSIPHNCLLANPLRVTLSEDFDTLSVYWAVV
jgi:hypothetical protein